MPLRFRTVVPYTLPGVLALIGWWWYISRKKERLISHGSPEEAPTDTGLRTSPAEGSNGLIEKGTVSPTNDTECPTHRPPKVTDKKSDPENISLIHVLDSKAAPLPELSSEEAASLLGRITGEEVHNACVLTQPAFGKGDSLQVSWKDHKDAEKSSSLGLVTELEIHQLNDPASAPEASVEEVVLPCRSNDVTSCPPTTAYLSEAERPEPEGEVAKYHSTISAQDEIVVCAVTPAKVQRAIRSEADTLETPPSAQDFHQHILTSTPADTDPTSIASTIAQDSVTSSVTPGDIQIHSSSEEEQDLERLAAGLICGVISAATQEVLGVNRCQVTDSSSTPLASGRQRSQQEPITTAQQHHHLLTSSSQISSREATEKEQPGMTNGCSSAPVWETAEIRQRVHQTNTQTGHWPTPSQEEAQSVPLLNTQLKSDEVAVLAEDSACSTCHSEDGISSEDLQNSMFDNQMDVIQITDLSAKEATQPQSLVETATDTTALDVTEENSVDAACEIKRLNGMGLRNGAHGACEVETDQSGGETSICLFWALV